MELPLTIEYAELLNMKQKMKLFRSCKSIVPLVDRTLTIGADMDFCTLEPTLEPPT
jgi:hypothetical protein